MSWSPPERSPSSGQQHQFSAPAPPKSWNFNFKSKGKIIIVNQLWKASSRLKGSQNTSGVLQSHSPVCRISEELHVAVPTAHIECLIIKVRPVCLLWLLLSSDWWSPEAMGRYVNSPTRGRGGNSDGSSSVCVCVCVLLVLRCINSGLHRYHGVSQQRRATSVIELMESGGRLLAQTVEMCEHKCCHASINQHIKWRDINPQCPQLLLWWWQEIKHKVCLWQKKDFPSNFKYNLYLTGIYTDMYL